jgi:predicted Zn-dependent protease
MGDADGALEKFLEATRADPQYPQAWLLVADSHLQRGELEPAIAACTRAISIDAEFADAHLELALATMAAGRPRDAIEHLDAAEHTGTSDAAWQEKLAAARASCEELLDR